MISPPYKQPIILVTGATGSIGPFVVSALRNAGYRIRTLSLNSPTAALWPEDVETLTGDIMNPGVIQSAMVNVDSVIHLAALLHIMNPPPNLQEQYERVNVGGTDNVVKTAIRSNVRRVVFFSTIAVYGNSEGRIVDEGTSPQPQTFYARTKLSAEPIVLNAENSVGQSLGTVLRPAAVYGSRVKGNYRELVKALANRRFVPIGDGENRRTLIYTKDLGRAAVIAVSHPAAAGKIFNVTDGKYHTVKEIMESICFAMGRRPPKFSIPLALAQLMAGIIEEGTRLFGGSSAISRQTIHKYTEDIAVSGERMREELGFVPQYDLHAGWKEAIREMRESYAL